jgi:cellulose synthase (UDP-forming)
VVAEPAEDVDIEADAEAAADAAAEPDGEPEPDPEPVRITARAAVRKRSRLVAPSMPTPPTDDEKWLYIRRGLALVVLASTLSLGCLVVSQALFVRLSPWLLLLVPLFVFTLLYYLISVVVNAFTPDFDLAAHQHTVERWRPGRYPSVDVFLPICGEPVDVLRNTWRHVKRMAEHYGGPVQVYVLDDSVTDERAAIALSFGFIHQRRPNRGWYMKAGNLRYAYRRTMGEFILVLDADFSPRHDMLDEMMPYFHADEHLGIVQSPQFFRTHHRQGWLERGAGAVQELFYRLIQVSRQRHGAAICVGSCAVYRRAALDSTGGSTLIEHSEDVHTGFDLRRKGWSLKYLPIPLATGLCPGDVNSFFTQQYRWCAGSMSLLGSTKFWNTRMPLRTRLSYLSGFCYYVHTAVFTLAGPVVPILMLAVFPHEVAIFNYVLIAPSLLYNMVLMPLWHKCSYGLEAWTVKMLYGWAHAWAVWDILMGQRMRWQSTGGTVRKRRTTRLWIGMTAWTAGTTTLWTGLAAWHLAHTDILAFTPPFLVGAFFLTITLQAILVNPVRDMRETSTS